MFRYLIVIILSIAFPTIITAQFCTGALGENIFPEGDFGSGTSNLFPTSPNIAPGFSYTLNVPPIDGSYVLTNNTANWPELYSSWLSIGDNSLDPNGYMMVVNASFEPGLFYRKTVTGLCENTLYEFSVDIINLIQTSTTAHEDPNVSFLLDGIESFSTGTVPKNEEWNRYGFTFTTKQGQETLTLSLRNEAPGGIGNDLAIDNISFRACGPMTTVLPEENMINLCEENTPIPLQAIIDGTQYVDPALQWQQSFDEGLTWINIPGANQNTYTYPPLQSGMYYFRFVVAEGISNLESDKCRVNSPTKIINVIPKVTMLSDTICKGLTILLGNSVYSEQGTYRDTLVNSVGCDSIVILDLSVFSNTNLTVTPIVSSPCPNFNDGSIELNNIDGGFPPYNFIFEGADSGSNSLFTGLAGEESYSIIIEDNIGCVIDTTVFVENISELMLDLGEDITIDLGESVEISPFYNFLPTDFSWEVNTPLDCNNFEECNELNFAPTSSQLITLTLLAGLECTISDSIFVQVNEVRKVYIPNIFSPNGDGTNDHFTIFADTTNVEIVEDFLIFDRWGARVYGANELQPNDLENGWDGKSNGQIMTSGIYVYVANIRFADGVILQYTGDVFLAL